VDGVEGLVDLAGAVGPEELDGHRLGRLPGEVLVRAGRVEPGHVDPFVLGLELDFAGEVGEVDASTETWSLRAMRLGTGGLLRCRS
jgi:hypothetical protein